MPAQWAMPCLQWAAGEEMCHLPPPQAFYFTKLETNMTITYVMYFGYMGIVCVGLFLLTGTVGLGASLWFTKVIYRTLKVE